MENLGLTDSMPTALKPPTISARRVPKDDSAFRLDGESWQEKGCIAICKWRLPFYSAVADSQSEASDNRFGGGITWRSIDWSCRYFRSL